MKALLAVALFLSLSACTKPGGEGSAEGDDGPAATTETGTQKSTTGSGSDKADEENYGGKNAKDVETDTSAKSEETDATGGSTNDSGTSSNSTADTDIDGVTDDKDLCPGEDDALQVTRYKLTDADNDSYADGSLSATVCPSNTEYTLTLLQVVYNDCNSSDASKWQMLSYTHRDADGDSHSIASAGSVCSGAALATGYLTSALGTADCDDTNGSYHTLATYYAYNADATTSDRYSRVSESRCVPTSGYGPLNAYKEYRLTPEIISASGLSNISAFYEFNGKMYFRASTSANGNELWATDGTLNGASMIKDIYSGAFNSSPANFISAAGTLFFTAQDGTGINLWKTDGTEAGTTKVKSGIQPSFLTEANGMLFFAADDGLNGTELWKTDGTEAGTVMVKDINPDSESSSPTSLTNVNGTLYFAANDGSHGIELWKSNGTEAGTVLVKDIVPASQSSPSEFLAIGSTLFFTAAVSSYGRELWKSDGTEAGTVLVKDINPGVTSSMGGEWPPLFTAIGSSLYFRADDGSNGLELWKSDGTEAGTVMIKDIAPIGSSTPASLTAVNGTLFFTADNGSVGTELWKSDGTEVGTVLVKDIRSGGSITMHSPTATGGLLYFRTDDGTHGLELWKSNGTETGTILVKDINPNGNSNPQSLAAFANNLVFVATTSDGARIHITPSPL